MSYLVLVRHGESEWNAKGIWTGWTDIPLSEKGRQEAKDAAGQLRGLKFDIAFTSTLSRAKETLEIIKQALGIPDLPTIQSPALNERDYGDYTGKNKWEVKKQLGPDDFAKLRRGWNWPVPNGETLKDVYERTVPYYLGEILPKLEEGKNVLISAHGNSLRALVKYLDGLSDDEVENLEIATGETVIYQIDNSGKITSKELRKTTT